MAARPQRTDDLLVSSNFIQAVRESGYVSLSTALAELVDNSLEAQATVVAISVDRSGVNDYPQIVIEDNGRGMSAVELSGCLRFGGSSRFGGQGSFGRFGMGLPSASLSQSRHIEVTAWHLNSPALTVSLDVDRVASGQPVDMSPIPGLAGSSASGCRVLWRDCDRIEYQRFAWLERALHRDLGRMFRRFLKSDLHLTINGKKVEPVDPTLLTTIANGTSASLAFAPIKYEVQNEAAVTGLVTVRFSILPVDEWHALNNITKRKLGIVGHGGVSILRAGREIANGWHLMGSKRKENYDDWWRCEIDFDPDLDDQFGITINKQGIRPSRALRDALEPELESIARMLNGRVRQLFEDVKFRSAVADSCRIADNADVHLPLIPVDGTEGGPIKYSLMAAQLPPETMFASKFVDERLTVTLNVDHPAFTALYKPLQDLQEQQSNEARTALELMIISYARAALQVDAAGGDLLQAWSATYGRMLQRS